MRCTRSLFRLMFRRMAFARTLAKSASTPSRTRRSPVVRPLLGRRGRWDWIVVAAGAGLRGFQGRAGQGLKIFRCTGKMGKIQGFLVKANPPIQVAFHLTLALQGPTAHAIGVCMLESGPGVVGNGRCAFRPKQQPHAGHFSLRLMRRTNATAPKRFKQRQSLLTGDR